MVRPLRREGALLVLLTFLSIMVTEGVGAELDTDSLSHAPHSGTSARSPTRGWM